MYVANSCLSVFGRVLTAFGQQEVLGSILLLRARHRCQWIHPQNWYWSMFFCELVEVVLVDGPCELVVDRICPPVASPLLAPDLRGSTGTGG